jgi:hypothetical protein
MVRERIKCNDGFSMSVQASSGAYCTPRKDDEERYTHVEVGFPSEMEELLMPWVGGMFVPTEEVYGWVPAHIIRAVIDNHGGMISGELPPLADSEEE